ncbi:hypothetical protein [Mycoplasma wenyonii]|uniref:hypothetical protein n=1 Tax=Mycoplasma wenyonii TaxID=65123 RepID=UPI0011BD0275|nr:hypothetical protein [Mycoplasma wenyonii]
MFVCWCLCPYSYTYNHINWGGWVTHRETETFTVTEKGEKIGPIFNCNHNSKNYKVYLLLNKEGLTGKDITEKNIVLQVIEKEEIHLKL